MPLAHRRHLLSVIAASLLLLIAATASAEAPMPPFGARGQVAIEDLVGIRSGGVGFLNVLTPLSSSLGPVTSPGSSGLISYVHDKTEQAENGVVTRTVNMISFAPSLDFFVANRISLGLTAGFGYGWGESVFPIPGVGVHVEGGTSYTVGVAARAGYVIPLGAGFSLWPRVGVGYTRSSATTTVVTSIGLARDASLTLGIGWAGGVDAGVVFRPTRNLFFSATPELSVAHSDAGAKLEGMVTSLSHNTRMRFAGTLSLGVLLGT